MASPEEMATSMLQNLPEKTGISLDAWFRILKKSQYAKHGELVNLLKSEHGVTHGFANFIVAKYRATGDEAPIDPLTTQYSGRKAELRPIYDALIHEIERFGKDIELAPKKAYVSLRRNKQFGLIQPSTHTRVDIGLNLPKTKPTRRLEKSGSFNAMVSHRVRLESTADIDDELIAWIQQAYQGA